MWWFEIRVFLLRGFVLDLVHGHIGNFGGSNSHGDDLVLVFEFQWWRHAEEEDGCYIIKCFNSLLSTELNIPISKNVGFIFVTSLFNCQINKKKK